VHMSHRITLAGTTVDLLADRALFLPDTATLILADVHWGKAASFRAHGVPVPSGTTQAGLDRLTSVLHRTQARSLIVLGDLIHARNGMPPAVVDTIAAWREAHHALAITLVRGNHDYRAGDPAAALRIDCVDAPLRVGPFALHHHPTDDPDGYVLAGHVHPLVRLRGARGRDRLTLPCFAFGETGGLLPAFGEFTGGAIVEQQDYARTFVIADDAVLPLHTDACAGA
jgi:uncharacterized protein